MAAAQELAAARCLAFLPPTRGLVLLLSLLLLFLVSIWAHVAIHGGAGLLRLLHIRSNNLDNEQAPQGNYVYFSDPLKLQLDNSGEQNYGGQRQGKRMMMLLSSRNNEGKMMGEPGSKPPKCHNECDRCQGGVCVATPLFSRGSSTTQHAVWSCACLH